MYLAGTLGRSGCQARSMLAMTALKGPRGHPTLASDARARSAKTSKSCNPPRSERRCAAYKCITGVWQYTNTDVFKRTPIRVSLQLRHQLLPEFQPQQQQAQAGLQRGGRDRQIPDVLQG